MVFRLFGRSKAAPLTATEEDAQLRSPSPSASVSGGTLPPQSPLILPVDAKQGMKRSRSLSPNQAAGPLTDEIQLPLADSTELLALMKKVPPKTLHRYIITRIPDASPQEIASLLKFFATLTPPPKFHCVRCHKDFVEIENTDRSCLIPHDDESAEVEYVGNSKSKVAGVVGTTYETLWNCCNKVVEGDGDQGPPDGWCYEGFHTTDAKRARFRADSTPQVDKLTSCARLRCFNPSLQSDGRGRSQRAAARKSLKEESDEEDYDVHELEREAHALAVDSDEDGNARKKVHKGRKRPINAMDVEMDVSAPPSIPKSKGKGNADSMKSKLVAKSKTTTVESPEFPEFPSSPRFDAKAGDDVNLTAPTIELEKKKPKKPKKSRKSAGTDGGKYAPPKNDELSDSEEEDEKPKRKKARRKSIAEKGSAT